MRNFGIILASHGMYAKATLGSVEMIGGKQDGIIAIALDENKSAIQFREELLESVNQLKTEFSDVLVLVDLYGGTPFNETLRMLLEGEQFISYCGFNLPLVLATVFSDANGEDEIKAMVEESMAQTFSSVNALVGGE